MLGQLRESSRSVARPSVGTFFDAAPARLRELVELAQPRPADLAIDVATGTGHTALELARHVRGVAAVDLTSQTLHLSHRQAVERGLRNIAWLQGDAQALPFAGGVFDLYTVRMAAHHFVDGDAALAEAGRVLKPGGRAAIIDISPPPAARELLDEVERRRDPSHLRALTLDEWTEGLERAGLVVESAERHELDWDFEEWLSGAGLPTERVAEMRRMIEDAGGPAREALRPNRREGRLWHAYWQCLIRARKPWQ